ncbi:hypothetical protein LguiA_004617 [Lonicera macranthoides]
MTIKCCPFLRGLDKVYGHQSLGPEQQIPKGPKLLFMSPPSEEWLKDLVLQLTRRTPHTSHVDTLQRTTLGDPLAGWCPLVVQLLFEKFTNTGPTLLSRKLYSPGTPSQPDSKMHRVSSPFVGFQPPGGVTSVLILMIMIRLSLGTLLEAWLLVDTWEVLPELSLQSSKTSPSSLHLKSVTITLKRRPARHASLVVPSRARAALSAIGFPVLHTYQTEFSRSTMPFLPVFRPHSNNIVPNFVGF